MPHYADGTPAEVGDKVKGIPYNTKGKEVVGTLIQITEDTDSCNCIVAFVDPTVVDASTESMYKLTPILPPHIVRRKGGRITMQGGGEQEILLLNPKYDYGALSDFVRA
jgi:hypothetical protein